MTRPALGSVLLSAVLAGASIACGTTTLDSLGSDSDSIGTAGMAGNAAYTKVPDALLRVAHPGSYPNTFQELLAKSDIEISNKINAAFQQLFHGEAGQYIFYENQAGEGKSSIVDVLHNDVRTEGIGLAMLITVELDHKKEFDELWLFTKYAKDKNLFVASGPAAGYFKSLCGEDTVTSCYDVYGMQHFVLALMLAHARWHSSSDLPYESDALALLDALKNKEAENGGILNGVGSAFSSEAALVREEPVLADAGFTTRSSLQMPAAYWYWEKATTMPFWNSVATASRKLLVNAADPITGLWPMRSYFDGTPVDGSAGFTQQAYRTQLNLALDALWGTASADQAELANRLLNFFSSQGIAEYGGTFEIDGTPIDADPAPALVSVNGALAVAAPANRNRKAFVQAVWDQPIPTGDNRYYEGLLYLMSMLILSGQMQVY